MPFTNSTRGLFGAQSFAGRTAPATIILGTSVSPQIYWNNDTLAGSDGATVTSWANAGTFGSSYNGSGSGSPQIQTISGKKSVRLSNGNFLSHTGRVIMPTNSFGNGFTLAVVYKTDSATQKFTLLGTNGTVPGASNAYALIGNRGGTATQGQYLVWDNDGYPHANTSTGFSYSPDVTNVHQAIWRHNTSGNLQVWAPSKSSGSIYSSTIGIYASTLSQQTIGYSRLNSPVEEPWNLFEYIYWDSALSDSDINIVKNYFGAKFAGVGVVNS